MNVTLLQEIIRTTKESSIAYTAYILKMWEIDRVRTNQKEKALRPLWREINYFARGRKFRTREVRFRNEAITKQHSANNFKTDKVMFLSIYLGRCASRVR